MEFIIGNAAELYSCLQAISIAFGAQIAQLVEVVGEHFVFMHS